MNTAFDLPSEIKKFLSENMSPEDVTPLSFSLVNAAAAVHELAFNKKTKREEFWESMTRVWEQAESNRQSPLTAYLDDALQRETSALRLTPNLHAAIVVYQHAFHFKEVTKENFFSFMEKAWEAGEIQRKVYDMEREGSIMNEFGIVLNFACYIALFGESQGLKPARN